MSVYNLNIFTEKQNRAGRLRVSAHDSGTVEVLRKMLVLSTAHECAHASVSGHLNTGWIFCEQQRELMSRCSEIEKYVWKGEEEGVHEQLFHVVKLVLS
jgi:hypothetical protein